jgi:hypothetical protein
VKSKLNSVKRFKFSIKLGIEWYIKCPYLAKNSGKKIGQFGQHLAKNGQSLEKVSHPRGFHFHSIPNLMLNLNLFTEFSLIFMFERWQVIFTVPLFLDTFSI